MLRALFRSLTQHKLYTGLNLAGLSLGIAVFLTMALIVRYETRYDAYLPDGASLYRLDTVARYPGHAPEEDRYTSFFPAPFLKQDFASISDVLRVMTDTIAVRMNGRALTETISYTDPGFFSFFHLRPVDGDPATALTDPAEIAIPASLARKYFGTTHAVGRTLDLVGQDRPAVVSLVYADPPPTASNHFGIITQYGRDDDVWHSFRNWSYASGTLWARIPDPRALPALRAGLRHYMTRHTGLFTRAQIRTYFSDGGLIPVRLADIHFHDAAIGAGGTSRELVAILGLVGIAALLTAAINTINLATARSGLRAREVAVRKVLGATRAQLIVRYLGEALLLTTLAAFIGLSFTELGIRFVNSLGGWHLALDPLFSLPVLACVTLVVGCGAGLYPALILSGYRPAPVLASSRMPSGGRMGSRLRSLLVLLQFGFAIGLGICTLVMTEQARFIQTMARGINTRGLIVIGAAADPSLAQRQTALLTRLSTVPGVTQVERSDLYPHHLVNGMVFKSTADASSGPGTSLQQGFATPGFASLYGFRMLAGRWFDARHGDDYLSGGPDRRVRNAVISRLAAKRLGFASPADAIGRTIRSGRGDTDETIIGVMEDARLQGPHDPLAALHFAGLHPGENAGMGVALHVGYAGVSTPEMMARLRAAWTEIAPDVPFDAISVADILADDGRDERQHGTLFAIGAAVAIGIACLGLYGLSLFTVSRRRQEIGIRKVLGARTRDVLALLVGQFLRPVLLANLIAWPAAWMLMRTWLSGFDQRIALTPMPFVEVALTAMAIGGATVIGQTLRAARLPPALAMGPA